MGLVALSLAVAVTSDAGVTLPKPLVPATGILSFALFLHLFGEFSWRFWCPFVLLFLLLFALALPFALFTLFAPSLLTLFALFASPTTSSSAQAIVFIVIVVVIT